MVQRKKVFVTGAGGFIGSHLVEHLVELGHEVTAFVEYNSTGNWGWLEKSAESAKNSIKVELGDVRDYQNVLQAMRGNDVVLHLAALIAIPYSYVAARSYVDTNVIGTLNVVQAAREIGVSRIIHTSTSEVYGTAQYVPMDEKHRLLGQSPYSASKIAADQIAYSFFSSFELPLVIARPFNTYGPRQSSRAVIPTIISQILSNQKTIKLGALSPTRDLNYVSDTVSGFTAIMNSDLGCGEVFNIGSGFEVSIGALANLIAQQAGANIQIEPEKIRERPVNSEVERLLSDSSKIHDTFGWTPKYSGIEGLSLGLSETIDWFSKPENLEMYKSEKYVV